jgi:type IV secretory pathway VirB10-like protein
MPASTAYFAGAGTVIAAIVAGVGGGLVIADMISPKSPKQGTELSRVERRMSSEPIQAASGPSEPVQYVATTQQSAAVTPVAAAPVQAQAEASNSGSTRAQAAIAPPAVSDTQAAASAPQPAARQQTAVPDDAFARARAAEAKRAMEKRKAERRQQWAEKRRQRQQQELRAVEQNVRQDTEPRQFAAEPVRMQAPQFRLFGLD